MKKLGLIGGTGPESTIEYYRQIEYGVQAKTGRFPHLAIESLSVFDVFAAASNGDQGASEIVDRAIQALGTAIKAAIYLVDPGKIVLYGSLFEDTYYLSRLISELQEGVDARHDVVIEKSKFNQQLEDRAACLLAVQNFIDNGGIR